MKRQFKTFLWLILLSPQLVFTQQKTIQKMLTEPQYTVGNFNIVYLDTIVDDGEFWVFNNSEDHYFAEPYYENNGKTSGLLKNFPPEIYPEKQLKHDTTYFYYFKFSDGTRSNIVKSTQDQDCPELIEVTLRQPINDWYNTNKLLFQVQTKDPAGIDSIFVTRIFDNTSKKWFFGKIYYSLEDTTAIPPSNITTISDPDYQVPIKEDGIYTFQFGAKDAAHAAESCSTQWKLNGNRCLFENAIFKNIKVDLTPPKSEIRGLEDTAYTNQNKITLNIWADDPPAGTQSIESGLNSVTIQYKYRQNPLGLWSDWEQIAVIQKSGTDEITFSYDFTFPKGEGWYQITTGAQDLATNVQAVSARRIKVICFDKTNPVLISLELKDTTQNPAPIETIAATGWTNNILINALIDTSRDYLTKNDSIIFSGDVSDDYKKWHSFSSPFSIELTSGDNSKQVACKIKDKASNVSDSIIAQIDLDTDTPELESINLYDYDMNPLNTLPPEITDKLLIKIKAIKHNDNSLSHILYFEGLLPNPAERENRWREYQEVDDFTCTDPHEPYTLLVKAIVHDYAGNISKESKSDDIYYDSLLTITTLKLQDLDGQIIDEQKRKFTNNMIFNATLYQISRPIVPSMCLEFSNDNKFDTLKRIHFSKSEKFVQNSISVSLNLRNLNYNNDNNAKEVYVRLVDSLINITSNVIKDTIFLDTIPPKIKGLKLFDRTKEDNLFSEPPEFKADEGWTNDTMIYATLDTGIDNLSGIDSLCFWGDVVNDSSKFKFKNNERYPLNLKFDISDNKPQVIKVKARDLAGNWGGELYGIDYFDTDSIIFDGVKPDTFKILKPEENEEITKTDSLDIEFEALDLPFVKNFYRIYIHEKGYSWQDSTFPEISSSNIPLRMDISENEGDKSIEGYGIDHAGNFLKSNSRYFKMIFKKLYIQFKIYASNDTNDSVYTNTSKIYFKSSIKPPNSNVTKFRYSQDRDVKGTYEDYPQDGFKEIVLNLTGRGENICDTFKIYSQCKTNNGIESLPDSAWIVFDNIPPKLDPITINSKSAYTDQLSVNIYCSGSDTLPGRLKLINLSTDQIFSQEDMTITLTDTPSTVSKTIPYIFKDQSETKTIYVKLMDQAENETIVSNSIKFYEEQMINGPNPFKPPEKTNIIIPNAPTSGDVELKIYDVFGNLVLLDYQRAEMGEQWEYTWDGKNGMDLDVAEGVYLAIAKFVSGATFSTKIGVVRH